MAHIPNIIQQKLERFLKKYYRLKLIKGSILGFGLLGMYFLLLATLEWSLRMNQQARMVLFFSFLVIGLVLLTVYVLWPLLQLFKLGRKLSYEAAANLIGKHFKAVDDKLLNLLQLQNEGEENEALIAASIEQRAKTLKPYDFSQALQLKSALRFWPLLAIPVLLVIALTIGGQAGAFGEATNRVVRYSEDFKPAFPFEISLSDALEVERGSNYRLEAAFRGEQIPSEMLLNIGGRQVRMVHQGKGVFTHAFNRLQNKVSFFFEYGDLSSGKYDLHVKEVPQLKEFIVEIQPPAYTGFKPSLQPVENVLTVAEGSKLRFIANVAYVEALLMNTDSDVLKFSNDAKNQTLELAQVREAYNYQIEGKYEGLSKTLSPSNTVLVIKDAYPKVTAEWQADSLNPNEVLYRYSASDDYGLQSAKLIVRMGTEVLDAMAVAKGEGFGRVDLSKYAKDESKKLEVYVQVVDNDAINGGKASRSSSFRQEALSDEAYKARLNAVFSKLGEAKSELNKELKQQVKEYQEQLQKMKSGTYKWKDKKALEELIKEQKALLEKKKALEEKKKELEEKRETEKKKEDIRQKEKEKELEKLLEELEKLKEKLGIKELQQKLEKIEQLSEQLSQQEQRQENLEKKLESERAILEALDKLNELQEQQEEAASKEEFGAEEQQEIEEALEKVSEELEKQREENNQFDQAAEKKGLEEKQAQAEQDVDKAGEKQNQRSKSKQQQSKAAESLKEMAKGLQQAFMEMQSQQDGEDAQMLRQILENVEELSHETERVLEVTKRIESNDPQVKNLLLDLNKLSLGTGIIRDSLTALANRNPKIKQKVFDELMTIETNQRKSLDELQNVALKQSSGHQQYIMLAANNLALMLDASLQQMMQQMAQSKPGNQNCQKPGGKKPSKAGMAKMQAELAQQMSKRMKGQKEGEGKEGKGKGDGEGDKGELARMISKQEQLREAYEKMMNEKGNKKGEGEDGLGPGDKPTDKLFDDIEKDLYEDNITPETLERVKEIESRMLKDERAERKQEMDEQREAEVGKGQKQDNWNEIEFFREKQKAREEVLYEELYLNPRLFGTNAGN
jgi:hypothetical protein